MGDAKQEIGIIRKIIKKQDRSISVTMGKGTSYGYVNITGKDYSALNKKQVSSLKRLGINACESNCIGMDPYKRRDTVKKWKNKGLW